MLFRRREFTVPKTSHRGRLFTPAFRLCVVGQVWRGGSCADRVRPRRASVDPEMFELGSRPTMYDAARGGVKAGGDTVKLFPGAMAVLSACLSMKLLLQPRCVSTTEPAFASTCLAQLPIDPSGARQEKVADIVDYRQIYPGSKGGSTSQPCTRSLRSRLIRCSSSTTARTATIAETLHAGARGRPVFGRPTALEHLFWLAPTFADGKRGVVQ